MNGITINSYAKINLSIDVLGINDNGYHEVSMIMQQIALHDDVMVRFIPKAERTDLKYAAKNSGGAGDFKENTNEITIELSTNRPYLPKDERNIAYKAAMLMAERFGGRDDLLGGKIRIDIKKRIPVAAGLAGGSGNAAAVLHALNVLWDLKLTLDEIKELGAILGSDVPFCIMGQAAGNRELKPLFADSPDATCAALATGTGTDLKPVKPLRSDIILVKPNFSVSTRDVYNGVDAEIARYENNQMAGGENVLARPDNDALIDALKKGDRTAVVGNMINLLELYTLKAHPEVAEVKEKLAATGADAVLMSGSGPTVFAVYFNHTQAEQAFKKVRRLSKETFLTRTMY